MDGLARSWRPEEFVKEAARPSDAAKQQTAKRPESSVKSEAKKKEVVCFQTILMVNRWRTRDQNLSAALRRMRR